jgi:hypothetical protein
LVFTEVVRKIGSEVTRKVWVFEESRLRLLRSLLGAVGAADYRLRVKSTAGQIGGIEEKSTALCAQRFSLQNLAPTYLIAVSRAFWV